MVNFKKMDEHDFVFINEPLNEKEEKDFSDFLKKRKTKAIGRTGIRLYKMWTPSKRAKKTKRIITKVTRKRDLV